MRGAFWLAGVCLMAGQAMAQPLGSADWHRAILKMAVDPAYKDFKIRIGDSKAGSLWWIDLQDLAEVYKAASPTPMIWVHIDASKDKSVPWRRRQIQFVVRCADRTYDTPAMMEYRPDGSVSATDRHETTAATMAPVPPGSMADTIATQVCNMG